MRNPFTSLRNVVTALVGVAAVLVSIAAVVYIVDTVRGDDGADDGTSVRRQLSDDTDGAGNRADGTPDDLRGGLLARVGGTLLGVSVEEDDAGLVVQDVVPGSPADKAGIVESDVISAVDGESVATVAELREAIAAVEPGAEYELTVTTDGDERAVAVTRPEADGFDRFVVTAPGPLLGVTAEDGDDGVVVVSVLEGLGAEAAGIEEGDVIRAVDGTPVETVADLRELLAEREADETVSVELDRAGEPLEVSVALSPSRGALRDGAFGFSVPGGVAPFGNNDGLQGLTPRQLDEFGPLLDGLDPAVRARLERIIEELLRNGYTPPAPVPGQRVPSGA